MKQLWVDKHRPKTFDEYVWTDPERRTRFDEYISENNLPHLLLTGGPGTGKTSIAKLLLDALGIHETDVLTINASMENGIETIRNKVANFAGMIGFGGVRVVILDEADWLTISAQGSLRSLISENSETTRFILTANYPNKIMAALKSRCHHYHFERLDINDYTIRAATVLTAENVKFDVDTLDFFVQRSYPDLRKCINDLEQNTIGGVLTIPRTDDTESGVADYMTNALDLFRKGKITEARKVIIENADQTEYLDIYRFLYQNLDIWGDDARQKRALIIIANGLRDHSMVGDIEINLSATITRLEIME